MARTNHKIGDSFGKLIITSCEPKRIGGVRNIQWLCRCDCGSERYYRGDKLRMGEVKSCSSCTVRRKSERKIVRSYDLSDLGIRRAHQSWRCMKDRCLSKFNDEKKLKNYRNKGISVCLSWKDSFVNFLADMGPRPKNMTLGRIDGNGNYEISNCRWETIDRQNANRSDTVYVDFQGKRQKLVVLCRRLGVDYSIISGRLRSGWPIDKAMKKPPRRYRKRSMQA